MSIDNLSKMISTSIKDRFIYEEINEVRNDLISLAGDTIPNKNVLRLRRNYIMLEPKVATWKTLLLVEIENRTSLKNVLYWASLVQDYLIDPETADLYLFICFKEEINLESCLRIESTEQFCRKYVLRPSEQLEDLIQRSFLGKIEGAFQASIQNDPLQNAFNLTRSKFDWLTEDEQF